MEQEQKTLPSRKKVHHRPKSDYSQWFRMVLVVLFVCIVLGSIYWGYDKSRLNSNADGLQPGIVILDPPITSAEPDTSSDASSDSSTQGLEPIDTSDPDDDESSDNESTEGQPAPNDFSGHTHIVQQGETLYSIAMQYFADNSYVDKIARLNNLNDQKTIYAGFELKLPTKTP
jgi:LysM repeat protein